MRISTSQIYEAGSLNIQRNQSALYKLQNQLSTGRRVLTPADDPIAAAQSLLVTQSLEMNAQQITNQGAAESQLGLVDTQLSAVVNLIMNVRDRVIQAGNTSLSDSDRESIANELEARLSELIGIANAQNGSGNYLFSGYQGATTPFAVDASAAIESPSMSSPIAYYGDNGERLLQVSSSRVMPVNVAGSDVFMDVKQGNGTFFVDTSGNFTVNPGPPATPVTNLGSATPDSGSVLDQQKWQTAINSFDWLVAENPAIKLEFTVDVDGATTYQLFDVSDPDNPQVMTGNLDYTQGQVIPIESTSLLPPYTTETDFGAQFVVKGTPASGDSVSITPSANQSLFLTMQKLIGAIKTPLGSGSYTTAEYTDDLRQQLANLDRAMDNIVRVQAEVGTRMLELDSLSEAASDLDLQYETSLSNLQDLDYAEAISKFSMQQTYLEAAQASFSKISGLSLFNYL